MLSCKQESLSWSLSRGGFNQVCLETWSSRATGLWAPQHTLQPNTHTAGHSYVYRGAYMGLSARGIMQLFLVSHMSRQCHSHSGCQHLSFRGDCQHSFGAGQSFSFHFGAKHGTRRSELNFPLTRPSPWQNAMYKYQRCPCCLHPLPWN